MNGKLRSAALLAAWVCLGVSTLPGAALADVERIREKALELEQKLGRHLVDVHTRGEVPKTARVYKDFDYILKESKIKEAREDKQDPRADRLADFLTQAMVEAELATYSDDLASFLLTSTADMDGTQLTYSELAKRLATSGESAERRKISSLLGPMVETSMVFRSDLVGRRGNAYRAHGYAGYAEFFAQREGLDLDALAAEAESVLAASETLYDTLLARASKRYLGVEPRQVKYSDLAYLTQGVMFGDLFPGTTEDRMKATFRGLGIGLGGVVVDDGGRPGDPLGAQVIPVLVPSEIHVDWNAIGGERDAHALVYAVGEALIHAKAKDPGLEVGYLANEPAASALAWIPSLALEEPSLIRATAQGDPARVSEYIEYCAFLSLFELRSLAGLTLFELHVFRGDNPEKTFQEHFAAASGIKVTQTDSHRGLEYLSELQVASRFRGLLAAATLRDHLRATLGDDWYAEGKAGAVLGGLWAQGGDLTIDGVLQAAGGLPNSPQRRLQQIMELVDASAAH